MRHRHRPGQAPSSLHAEARPAPQSRTGRARRAGTGSHRPPRARRVPPRPPGLVHRAGRRRQRLGDRRVHRSQRGVAEQLAPQDGLFTLVERSAEGDGPRSSRASSRSTTAPMSVGSSSWSPRPPQRSSRSPSPRPGTGCAPTGARRRRPRGRRRHRAACGASTRPRRRNAPPLTSTPGYSRARGASPGGRRPARRRARATTCRATGRHGVAAWSSSPRCAARLARLDLAERVVRVDLRRPHHPAAPRARTSPRSPRSPGGRDASPVVTEPFSYWVLSGEFPAGRPALGTRGRTVRRRHRAVRAAQAVAAQRRALAARLPGLREGTALSPRPSPTGPAPRCWHFWDEAERHFPSRVSTSRLRAALLERFENARIEHQLAQIAEGLTKLRVRIVPVARAERAAGRPRSGRRRSGRGWRSSRTDTS